MAIIPLPHKKPCRHEFHEVAELHEVLVKCILLLLYLPKGCVLGSSLVLSGNLCTRGVPPKILADSLPVLHKIRAVLATLTFSPLPSHGLTPLIFGVLDQLPRLVCSCACNCTPSLLTFPGPPSSPMQMIRSYSSSQTTNLLWSWSDGTG